MENHLKQSNEDYQLLLLTEKHIQTIFNWNIQEKNFEYYTCRPLKLSKSFEEYATKILARISEGKARFLYRLQSRARAWCMSDLRSLSAHCLTGYPLDVEAAPPLE